MENLSNAVETAEQALSRLSGGNILDVATGGGGFITFLLDNIRDYAAITGIDLDEKRLESARAAYPQGDIHFLRMDAAQMDFQDAQFDIVCMANSLHHMEKPDAVLAEMRRVCKPAGNFIIHEMYRDGQCETQQTHVALHHWWAAVDRGEGTFHHETFTRQELVGIIERVELLSREYYDISDLESDPKDAELTTALDGVIDGYIARAQQLPEGVALRRRGEQLRARVHRVGFHAASSILMIGKK